MADLAKVKLPSGSVYNLKDSTAREKIANLATVATTGKYGDLKDKPIYYRTTAEWAAEPSFKGKAGDICIYSDYKTITEGSTTKYIAGIKVADGNAYIVDKPFITEKLELELAAHTSNTDIHTTSTEKTFWNNKVNVEDTVTGETLVIKRN